MTSTLVKTLGLTAFSLFISISANAEIVRDCKSLSYSKETLDAATIAKCQDLTNQKQPVFLGQGSGSDIGGCMKADSRSVSLALNSCRTYAVETGVKPESCTKLTTYPVSDGYTCHYESLYYLKNKSAAFIGFTLDQETQTKLFEEAQARSITVRQLINEKLRR